MNDHIARKYERLRGTLQERIADAEQGIHGAAARLAIENPSVDVMAVRQIRELEESLTINRRVLEALPLAEATERDEYEVRQREAQERLARGEELRRKQAQADEIKKQEIAARIREQAEWIKKQEGL
jgi:hypothetical protein